MTSEEDRVPGRPPAERSVATEVSSYLLGLALAVALTAVSFWVVGSHLVYGPGIAVAILVLAVAQMGIHLVFFLHITTAPDNTNNVLALAFGILIVFLVVTGSLWIMANMNHMSVPMDELMRMQP